MFQELNPHDFAAVRPLLSTLPHHLLLACLLDGTLPGRIWVDDPTAPRLALLSHADGQAFLGEPYEGAEAPLRSLLEDALFTRARQEGWWQFLANYPSRDWEPFLTRVTGAKYPVWLPRQYYEGTQVRFDWRADPPPGFELRPIDADLLARGDLVNIQRLRDWANEGYGSVDGFVTRGYGYCALRGHELASWCLSDCTRDTRTEVGIHTAEAYRGRGLAKRVAAATVEQALSRGITHVGWHCNRFNTASVATALAVGLAYVCDYWDLRLWFNDADACLANGNICLLEDRVAEAADWFDRAFAQPDLGHSRILSQRPDRARYCLKAAYAHAHLGQHERAEKYLRLALDSSNDRWWGY